MGRRVNHRDYSKRPKTVELLEPRRLCSSIYVDANAVGPAFDGMSWSSPLRDLQQALSIAKAGDYVLVAGGVYVPSSSGDRSASFRLKSGVNIWGGYAGSRKSDPYRRDPSLWVSVLSGEMGIRQYPSDNSRHVVTAAKTDRSATLDGFTITGGYADDASGDGAGLYLKSGATISNCIIEGNEAMGRGGGMFNGDSSSLYVRNCTFVRNKSKSGGGLAIAFVGPSSTPHPGPVIINCMFNSNSAYQFGGGVCSASWSPTFFGCTFVANYGGSGGGFANVSPTSTPVLSYMTFTKNQATTGGAIFDNFAATTVSNSIIWDNSVPDWGQDPEIHGTLSVDHSDVQGGAAGVGNIDSDPLFVRAPSSDSTGYWVRPDDDFGDLRLQLTSPCVDAGSVDALVVYPLDLAGKSRVFDVPNVREPGENPDMGVFEYQPNVLAARPATPDGLSFSGGGYLHQIRFEWDDVEGEAGYDIYRSGSSSGWNVLSTSVRIASTAANVTVFEDKDVLLGWDYSYWVQARPQRGGPQFFSGMAGPLAVRHKHMNDGVLTIEGTGENDKIRVEFYNQHVMVSDGRSDPYTPSEPVQKIQVFLGSGNDTLTADPKMQSMFIDAGTGDDTISGAAGNDTFLGGAGRDKLNGGVGNDLIFGGSQNDILTGGDGADRISGGDGNDQLFGGNQNDILYGEAGNDTIDGGNHNDRLDGGVGLDLLLGGKGNDLLFNNDGFRDTVDGQTGFDKSFFLDEDLIKQIEAYL